MSEFDLIARYFTRPAPGALLGVGDDCALMSLSPGMQLAVSSDMLVSGTHFFPEADPYLLGHKTLAVNLSDLAAMGAQPRWATLALSLPHADEAWLAGFSAGFFSLADRYRLDLVGGDTTRGPLNLCVTIMGEIPAGTALRRDGAQLGDDIWVSGELGAASLALAHLQGRLQLTGAELVGALERLHRPEPRVALGIALRRWASSAIDISDGLLADLGHVLERSGVGALIEFASLPTALHLASNREVADLSRHCVLAGGDDYELCFTAPICHRARICELAAEVNVPLTRIGEVVAAAGCAVRLPSGEWLEKGEGGYDHFA